MSQFQLEQELQNALRLDTTISFNTSALNRSSRLRTTENGSSKNRNLSAGRTNSSLLSSSMNRSRILALQQPQASVGVKRATSTGRLVSPGRNGVRNRSSSTGRNGAGTSGGDRFIPNRSTTDLENAHHSLANSGESSSCNTDTNIGDDITDQQRIQLSQQTAELLNPNRESRILSFKSKAPAADEAHANSLKVLYSTGKFPMDFHRYKTHLFRVFAGKPKAANAAKTRQVATKSERVLDAPDLRDDFYLHLLDWSKNNHMAVALHDTLFIWNAADGSIEELFCKQSEEDYISCVAWAAEGNYLAVGDSCASIDLWDVSSAKLMRSMRGHTDRISSLKWNNHILASGSRLGHLYLHDVRIAEHKIATLEGHSQEICGMAWSPESNCHILATGANDNLIHIWDDRNVSAPVHTFSDHMAAIKAVAFCPWQPRTLATGGGSLDRHIRIWNTATGNLLNAVDTGSQVSSIVWSSEEYKELASGHGYSHNQVTVWKYPSMTKVADLQGHTSRVLDLLKSPDGTKIASAAGDETIRMWKVWPVQDKKSASGTTAKKAKQPVSLFNQQRIR